MNGEEKNIYELSDRANYHKDRFEPFLNYFNPQEAYDTVIGEVWRY